MLQHLVDSAPDLTLVRASGVESEMELPFAALHQLCAPMLHLLDTLPEPQRDAAGTAFGLTSGGTPDRLLIGLAALNLVSTMAEERPLLCVIDDAHWLDRESTQALTFIGRRLSADPVGLIFATRHLSPDLAGFDQLVLGSLSDLDARRLLATVMPEPLDARVRDRIVAETGGNPLALVEWPRGLSPFDLADGFGMPARMPMATQIEESFRRRLADLPGPTKQFLTLASAEPTGDATTVWRAATALAISRADAAPAIDSGLIEIGVRVQFRHPLVRSAVYGAAEPEERQAAHRHLADATDPDTDPDRRAWHLALGSPGPDDDIAESLESSARRARSRGGFAAAGALLERSATLTVDPSRHGKRLLSAAAAYLEAGSFDRSAALLASAETTALDDTGRNRLDLLRARHASTGGDLRDAPALLFSAAKRLEPIDLAAAEHTYAAAMAAAVVAGPFARGISLREIAETVTSSHLPSGPSANDALVMGLAETTVLGPGPAASSLRRGLAWDRTEASTFEVLQWIGFHPAAASVLWDIDALRQVAQVMVDVTRDVGALTLLPSGLHTLALALSLEGDLPRAAANIVEAQEIINTTGSNLLPWSAANITALTANDDAERVIDGHIAAARARSHGLTFVTSLWAKATWCNGLGNHDGAFAAGAEALRQPWEWGGQLYFHELVEAATRTGQVAVARAAAERLDEAVEGIDSDWALGIKARTRALANAGGIAEVLYGEAIDRLGRTTLRPELARSHLLYGEWLRREDRRTDARGHLRIAFETFTNLGIRGFADRARHELEATGETVRTRSSDTSDQLTPQEAHIARLAADGLTNPEIGTQLFISPRTVEWHLRKVFNKLGVGNRRELSAHPQLRHLDVTT